MRIPESKIAEVASATDIVQVISDYVHLKKAGKDYRGICPFHGDKDPSFYVSPQKGIFHCFGCAIGGSVFNFIMRIENISFLEAVRTLARRFGVPFHLEDTVRAGADEKELLFSALETGRLYFAANLASHEAARQYLFDRGILEEWIAILGLGFAPDSWDGIHNHLRKEAVTPGDAVSAGLIRERTSGGYYDYFRSRIMIPVRNLNGQLVAFGGRILGEGDPKYLNSPESPIFHKKNILYGLDTAKEAIRREGSCVVVEGYFDQISLKMRGFENSVAPLGTAFGSEQVRIIKRFCGKIITVFDSDEAGLRALKRSIPFFLAEGMDPYCVVLDKDKDPDEAIRRLGASAFRRILDRAAPTIDFFLDSLNSKYDLNTIQGRNLAIEECLPILREVADSNERDYFIERFSSRTRIREDRLMRMLKARVGRSADKPKKDDAKGLFDFPADERNVVRGMLLLDGFIDQVAHSGVLKDLEDPVLSGLARRMIDFAGRTRKFNSCDFLNSIEDNDLSSIVAKWLKPRPEEDDLRPEVDGALTVHESLDYIRLRKLEKRKVEIKERMKKCPPGEDEYNLLAQELLSIGRRLHR